jgi:predicted HAD superfamily Cof-like phosphohydrolase
MPRKKLVGLDYAYQQVKQFHQAFGHLVNKTPTLLEYDVVEKRAKWMTEEVVELLEASREQNITEQADAYIDIIYFSLGGLVSMGVEPQKLFDIVQNANMSKLFPDGKPHYREDGKVIKPPEWEDPHTKLEQEIQRQIQ